MKTEHIELLHRLNRFELDESDCVLPFSMRLARDNGWTHDYARRVIEEYKRFTFLAVAAGHPVTPSDAVDQVWHEHLIYTQNYWKVFCGEILQTPFHHQPTKGGRAEGAKFRDWYFKTLESYQRFFNEPAPRDVWPSIEERFARKVQAFQRVNLAENWVIPKPRWRELAAVGMLLVATGIWAGCKTQGPLNLSPFDLTGPPFLALYFSLALLIFTAGAFIRRSFRNPSDRISPSSAGLDPYEMAWLSGGPVQTLNAAVVRLVDARALAARDKDAKLSVSGPLPPGAHPLERSVYEHVTVHPAIPVALLRPLMKTPLEFIGAKLRALHLIVGKAEQKLACFFPLLLIGGLLLFGIAKIFIGLDRQRPVGFLAAGSFFVLIAGLLAFARRPHRTIRGDRLLAELRQEHASLESSQQSAHELASGLPLAVALFGLAALDQTAHADLREKLTPSRTSSDGGGACGGGAGCGGDGAGGCGGGCGGCGG